MIAVERPRLTIITPTWHRPQLLVNCIIAVKRQSVAVEHIVVSDGPDQQTKALCRHFGVVYAHCQDHVGDYGNTARDIGTGLAGTEYLAFWDDDNIFNINASEVLLKTTVGVDLGVVQIRHWNRQNHQMRTIPKNWDGQFHGFHIDTACFCISREFLLKTGLTWSAAADVAYSADHQLCEKLRLAGARINFSETVIGIHI